MQNELLKTALEYARWGYAVIPIRSNKMPYTKWGEYQEHESTEDEIERWWKQWPDAMIGIVTGAISGLFVIDCDTKEGYEAIQKLLPDALLFPMARTPRGGWHLYFLFPKECKLTVGTGVMPGVDFRGDGGYIIAPPSVNAEGKGYTWQDGLAPWEVEMPELPDALNKNLSLYIGSNGHRQQKATIGDNGDRFFQQGRRDEDLFRTVNALVKTGCEIPYVEQVGKILARNSNPPFPEDQLQVKINSALKRAEKWKRNITAEVREWCLATTGHFRATEVHKELQLATRDDTQAANTALRRLCEGPEPLLEKYTDARGSYRRVDTTITFMDFASADPGNFIDVRLPLDLHKKTKFFPKGVAVFAGVSGMGKTLLLLNAIALNMGRFPIFYFNSEMSPEALKKKLSYFQQDITEWDRNMKVIDKWDFHNIADKVQPDALNVIDYLEPEGDKAFNIHNAISGIIQRLNKGLALIAIQKKPDSRLGTGGVYSIKAATLAIALDWGKIEIVKNRFREEDSCPSMNKLNFEVLKGHELLKVGNWYE
ncbi:MAG: bifunctional DNA primase/polymerase [Deltaproteobacteria bacterium]|nr:bifunctional DNA primase/polymerase [Deltaproteobacteria bacterium]